MNEREIFNSPAANSLSAKTVECKKFSAATLNKSANCKVVHDKKRA